MFFEDISDQKHLNVDNRRRRFDSTSKHGGYGGASTVRARSKADIKIAGLADMYLKITRPTSEGMVLATRLDKEVPWLLQAKVLREYDFDQRIDEVEAGHMFALPDLLEEECISTYTEHDKKDPDVIITTYKVQGSFWLPQDKDELAMVERIRQVRLCLGVKAKEAKGVRLFCQLRDAPLEKITAPSLLDNSCKFQTTYGIHFMHNPRVFADARSNYWYGSAGSTDGKEYLDVDLGDTCKVAFVSTQGQFPPIRYTDTGTGMRVIDEHSEGFNNWIETYELSYRSSSASGWIVLGEFKGNSDMVTEVAHDLARNRNGDLECRFLRFRPLKYHGKLRMRVGVYGRRPTGTSVQAHAAPEQVVQYSICQVKPNANLRRAPVGRGICRMGCARCTKYRGPCHIWGPLLGVRRKLLKEACFDEVMQATIDSGLGWQGDLPAYPSDHNLEEPPRPDGGEEVPSPPSPASTQAPPRKRPSLACRQNNSDPNLLSPSASSSLREDEDNIVVVDSEDLVHSDMGEWVEVSMYAA